MSLFVVLEGGEGSGKSTLAAALATRLRKAGWQVVETREPGGTPVGERMRQLLHEPLAPWTETFAFLLARAELVSAVIHPALDAGRVVICDRFSPSTFAYQGYGRGLDLDDLRQANHIATGGLEPGLVIYVDIDPVVGLARKHGESEAIRTGTEDLAFHRRVREGYRSLGQGWAGAWVEIDGSAPPAEVIERAWERLAPLLG